MKKTILSMLALSVLAFACKKDDDDDNNITINKELLLGKWDMRTQYQYAVDNNTSFRDTTAVPAGFLTNEFKSNGTVILSMRTSSGVQKDTSVYKIEGSYVIVNKKDSFKVIKLSPPDLQVYKKYTSSATKYQEFWFHYKKI